MSKVAIADLGTGNLRSVSKAVTYVSKESEVCITADRSQIENAEYLILPGQGAIGTWFNQLEGRPELKKAIFNRISTGPVLGICLGLQALYRYSEENGGTQGMGVLDGTVKHFSGHSFHRRGEGEKLKIPHMGWNQVRQRQEHPLWHGIKDDEYFYFVHSYYVESDQPQQVMGECCYGHRFTAAAGLGNIFATQFHPEKSHTAGLQLLKNFIHWKGAE